MSTCKAHSLGHYSTRVSAGPLSGDGQFQGFSTSARRLFPQQRAKRRLRTRALGCPCHAASLASPRNRNRNPRVPSKFAVHTMYSRFLHSKSFPHRTDEKDRQTDRQTQPHPHKGRMYVRWDTRLSKLRCKPSPTRTVSTVRSSSLVMLLCRCSTHCATLATPKRLAPHIIQPESTRSKG